MTTFYFYLNFSVKILARCLFNAADVDDTAGATATANCLSNAANVGNAADVDDTESATATTIATAYTISISATAAATK